MGLFQVNAEGLQSVSPGSFAAEGLLERQDLQQWLRKDPSVLGEQLLVIAEEFHNWEDSKRRIDLLALDVEGNLVVIELKRDEDGGHMELQAIRYAAMISAMQADDVIRTFTEFLKGHAPGTEDQAETRIRQFLEIPVGEPLVISSVPRIILVAADFSLEITTTVLFLIDRSLDIRCVQIVPYKVGETILVDLRQVIPLAQAKEYQVRLRQKQEVANQTSSGGRRELTLKILSKHGLIQKGTEIEIVPDALPTDNGAFDPAIFRARIVDPMRRESVVWPADNNAYSLSRLTYILADQHGMKWLANNIAIHWRIAGQKESMWQQAEHLAAQPTATN
jgi:hypothetical protein